MRLPKTQRKAARPEEFKVVNEQGQTLLQCYPFVPTRDPRPLVMLGCSQERIDLAGHALSPADMTLMGKALLRAAEWYRAQHHKVKLGKTTLKMEPA